MAIYDVNRKIYLPDYKLFLELRFYCPKELTFSKVPEIQAWLLRTFPDLARIFGDLRSAEWEHAAAMQAIRDYNARQLSTETFPEDPKRDPEKDAAMFLEKVRADGLEAAEAWWVTYDAETERDYDEIATRNYHIRAKKSEVVFGEPTLVRREDAAREHLLSMRTLYLQALAVACETCRTEIFEMTVGLRPIPCVPPELADLTSTEPLG